MNSTKVVYHYMSSRAYVDQLNFDYVKTYSFQRGRKFDEDLKAFQDEFYKLRQLKMGQKKLSATDEKRYSELLKLPGKTNSLLDENGQFHYSSEQTHTFKKETPELALILTLLKKEPLNVPAWVCAPIYRDAIVFYDKFDRIVSVLNICFSCSNMETKTRHHINADVKTYEELKEFFLSIGHQIENN